MNENEEARVLDGEIDGIVEMASLMHFGKLMIEKIVSVQEVQLVVAGCVGEEACIGLFPRRVGTDGHCTAVF